MSTKTIAVASILILILFSVAAADTSVCGQYSVDQHWTLSGSPYIITCGSVEILNGATLTIDPGVVVKKLGSGSLTIAGKLIAIGTPENSIVFTSAAATPQPGNWGGISFTANSDPSSRIAYASISYAGPGIYVSTVSPTFEYLSISNCSIAGIRLQNNASPVIRNSAFVSNTKAIENFSPFSRVDARLNWWNSTSGPGQTVSSGVMFEPWLLGPPSNPQNFQSAVPAFQTFNPLIGVFFNINFTSALSGNWILNIFNSAETLVRSFSGSGISGNVSWDGKNESGSNLSLGTYTYQLSTTASGGEAATSAKGTIILSNQVLQITSSNLNPPFISPNGDGIQETTKIDARFNYDPVNWTLNIKNSSQQVVRSASGQGPDMSFTWDGRDDVGNLQPDGAYTFDLNATAGNGSVSSNKTATIDTIFPVSEITSPEDDAVLSNVFNNGSLTVPIIGTASDQNLQYWTLQVCTSINSCLITVATGSTSKVAALLGNWASGDTSNGAKIVKLTTEDQAKNKSVFFIDINLGNFSSSQNTLQINGTTGQTVTYTSIVPFDLDLQLVIKDRSGQVIKTLFDGQRSVGTYNDIWDGTKDGGGYSPSSGYEGFAYITKGSYAMTWIDFYKATQSGTTYTHPTVQQVFDPFNNKPLKVSYTISEPRRITLGFSPIPFGVDENCDGPDVCVVNDEFQASGTYQYSFAGVDANNVFRRDFIEAAMRRTSLPKNAIILYGRAPSIVNVSVTPALFYPDSQTQNVQVEFTTYQNQPATLQIQFHSHHSGGLVRTITMNNVNPGVHSIPWDGKAENGARIVPGGYTVTAILIDQDGNQVKSQILTMIRY